MSNRSLVRALVACTLLACASCQRGKAFYPARGSVFANGKPAEGVTIIFHAVNEAGTRPIQPTAIVQADGTFELNSFLTDERELKKGAPAGQYAVTCTWYPPNLQDFLGREVLPDKLNGRYSDPKTSGLQATIQEQPNEVPRFELQLPKK